MRRRDSGSPLGRKSGSPSTSRRDVHGLSACLADGLGALGLALDGAQQAQLLDYLEALERWNRVYNVTAVREPERMLIQHVLDSLAVIGPLRRCLAARPPYGHPIRLLDVGSGAGLPGVAIAIAMPEIQVTCVDASARKAAFVTHVAGLLGMSRLRGVHARAQNLEDGLFDIVTARAFSSLADLVRWTAQLLRPGGVWMAMKGRHPAEELAALPASLDVFHVERLTVPGLEAERCLVWMRLLSSSGLTESPAIDAS